MAIFDLTLQGPLHQGEFVGISRESVLEWIPSDTLFAAILVAWISQGENPETILDGFFRNAPPFLLTSAFPRAGKIRFYPAPPRLPARLLEGGQSAKTLKKIRWLSKDVLDSLVKGEPVKLNSENFLHGGSIWLTAQERQQVEPLLSKGEDGKPYLWRYQVVPRVTVDRGSNASNLFHIGQVSFGQDCGLWCAIDKPTDAIRQAFTYLSDIGLGGLRSTGHGWFHYTEIAEDVPLVADGWGLSLSRYAPQSLDEITAGLQSSESAYKFVLVGGWCQDENGHPWRRRNVRLVAEGALLPGCVKGGLVDVRPLSVPQFMNRPVYRYAIPYLIPAGKLVEAS